MPKQNVPTLRLEGFNGEWSQSVLGSFARKVNEKNVDLSVAETFTNSAEKGVISQTEYFKHQVSNDMNLGGYYVVQPNDFIYNPRISTGAPVGPINRNKLERVGVVSPLYTVFRLSLIDHSFLDWFFKSPYWHGFMRENGDSGARGDRLSIGQDLFFQMPVATPPTLEEQQAIGAIFTNLDAAINQHTLKHKSLQQAKTALMQRMFPQEGQTVPELRLEGFDGEWELVSVDDVATRHDNERVPVTQKDRIPGSTPYYGANGIQDYVRGFTHKGPLVLVAEDGANDLDNYPVQYVTGCAWVNNHAHVLRCKPNAADAYFLKVALSRSDIKTLLVGGSRAKLNAAQLMQISFWQPTLEEQQAIGAVFMQLDTLIATEAKYIESLKQAKTALLQRMFI